MEDKKEEEPKPEQAQKDPKKLPNPVKTVTKDTYSRWSKECNGVIAGYIPEDELDAQALTCLCVTFNPELDAKYQKVWEQYLADPNADLTISAMKLYDVKTFKKKLVILGGFQHQIDEARKEMDTHPEMFIFTEDKEKEAAQDNVMENPLPGTGTQLPGQKKGALRKSDKQVLSDKEPASETTLQDQEEGPPAKKSPTTKQHTDMTETQPDGK